MKKVFMTLAAVLMGMTAANAQVVLGGSLNFTNNGYLETQKTAENGLTYKDPSVFQFGFAPRVGYMLNDQKIEIGIQLNLGYNQRTDYMLKYDQVEEEMTGGGKQTVYKNGKAVKNSMTSYLDFYVDPYARFRVVNAKGFGVWIEGLVYLGTSVNLKEKTYAFEKGYYKTGTEYMSNISERERKQETIDKQKELDPQKSFSNFTGGLSVKPVLTYDINEHWRLEAALNFLKLEVGGSVETSEVYKNVLKKEEGTEKTTTNSVYYNLGVWTGNVASLGSFTIGAAYKF